MRTAFIRALERLAAEDERIFLVCGDLGYAVVEQFAEWFPDRFLNVGVAEQNMVGIAAGLALTGKKVFTYSIVNFAVTRCLEQIRNDVCYHGVDVTIVAVGGGLAYGSQGYTHHGTEDIAFTRVLPGMAVLVPGDPIEATWATEILHRRGGPAYLRLARGGEAAVHSAPLSTDAGARMIELLPGGEVVVIATGAILGEAVTAVAALRQNGHSVALFSMPFVAPLDRSALLAAIRPAKAVVVVEEHLTYGGVGSAVAESLAELPANRPRLTCLGVNHVHRNTVGDQRFLRKLNGINAEGIARTVRAL